MILYHYTSNDAFLSIVKEKKFRLSNLNQSNDSGEGKYFIEQTKYFLNEESGYDYFDYFEELDFIQNNLNALGICFSSEGDMLSQWRAYAVDGAGISIGFDKKSLDEIVIDNSFALKRILFDEVKYLTDDNHNFPKEEIIKLFNNLSPKNYPNELDLDPRSLNEILPISLMQFFYKDTFFKEEKEWRLLISTVLNKNIEQLPDLKFDAKKEKLFPYISFPKKDMPTDIIKEIVLGPKNETPKELVEIILSKNGFQGFEVYNSGGSYR